MSDTAWCPPCRTYRQVLDTHGEELTEADGRYTYSVTALACGHETSTTPVRVGPLPGQPVPHYYHPPGDPR